MGKTREKGLILLIVLFLLTAISVYLRSEQVEAQKTARLEEHLVTVPGYSHAATLPLDQGTVSFLDLDDYIWTEYEKGGRRVSLYVGYYFSSDKISAAHSPLVCFPGQGWTLTVPTVQLLQVGNHSVKYDEMVASLDQRRELVLYWYQAYDKTENTIYKNKINTLFNQITGEKQEHAFVRVSIPIGESGIEEARTAGRDFVAAFYPAFLSYITSL